MRSTGTQPFSPAGKGVSTGTMGSPIVSNSTSYPGGGREGGYGTGTGLGFTAGEPGLGPGLGPIGSYGVGGYAGAGEDMGIDRVLRALTILGQASSVPTHLYADLSAVLQVRNISSRDLHNLPLALLLIIHPRYIERKPPSRTSFHYN